MRATGQISFSLIVLLPSLNQLLLLLLLLLLFRLNRFQLYLSNSTNRDDGHAYYMDDAVDSFPTATFPSGFRVTLHGELTQENKLHEHPYFLPCVVRVSYIQPFQLCCIQF